MIQMTSSLSEAIQLNNEGVLSLRQGDFPSAHHSFKESILRIRHLETEEEKHHEIIKIPRNRSESKIKGCNPEKECCHKEYVGGRGDNDASTLVSSLAAIGGRSTPTDLAAFEPLPLHLQGFIITAENSDVIEPREGKLAATGAAVVFNLAATHHVVALRETNPSKSRRSLSAAFHLYTRAHECLSLTVSTFGEGDEFLPASHSRMLEYLFLALPHNCGMVAFEMADYETVSHAFARVKWYASLLEFRSVEIGRNNSLQGCSVSQIDSKLHFLLNAICYGGDIQPAAA